MDNIADDEFEVIGDDEHVDTRRGTNIRKEGPDNESGLIFLL